MIETRRLTTLMVSTFIAITVFWIVSYWAISNYFGRPSNASDVGQLFGAIGALFSGWAFCGVLWAILLQRNAIEIQREDLKATIAEMKQSREAQEESAENLRAQVEAMRLQSRVQALNTMINVPLQIKGNTFLRGFSDKSEPLRDGFQKNLEELINLEQELRLGKEYTSNKANATDTKKRAVD
ncbi:hypothetical protein [Desulfobacula sp.]|uniref:Uncharacterized protein n=1 Tax=Candidatus Desulfatibia vada TaxID=2841696 RepID=A0A8J6TL09_9BACT|nr:hypothetical protein [Candidatus Desulfatibia vada]MBL6996598.1 hypothetical protein [Desulfobacula sp.]